MKIKAVSRSGQVKLPEKATLVRHRIESDTVVLHDNRLPIEIGWYGVPRVEIVLGRLLRYVHILVRYSEHAFHRFTVP